MVGIATACSPNTTDSKTIIRKLSVEEQNVVYVRVGRIINHGKCYENGIDINPTIKITASTINHGEIFSGKVYFPTPYFNKLAKCYSFTYKSRLSISTMLMPIEAHGQNQDTVFFEVSPDSLNKVRQGKAADEYELKARLRASFSDGISGYDITGAATKVRLFVRKP